MKTKRFTSLFLASVLATSAAAMAAGPWGGWRGSGGWAMGGPYQRLYNAQTVQTVKGTVEAVATVTPVKGVSPAVQVTLNTDAGALPVHLGPEWYVARLDVKIEPGDALEVKGSKVQIAGKDTLIAAEVRKGGSVLTLRDAAGVPVWAGWRN